MVPIIERILTHGERIAIISNGESFTYSELYDYTIHVAGTIQQKKLQAPGERIAFMHPPGFEYTATLLGIWLAGCIAVPICLSHPDDYISYTLQDTKPTKVICDPQYESRLSKICVRLDIELEKYIGNAEISLEKIFDPGENGRAIILYTSGTTSVPKGVVLSHGNLTAQIKTLVKAWDWAGSDHILHILPLHHVHGIVNVLCCALWSGAICEFLPRFDAGQVMEKFLENKINVFMAVPTVYYKLIRRWEELTDDQKAKFYKSCKKFRLMVSGSAALPISILENWEKISGQRLLERYGMTEMGMALSNPYRGERRPGFVGIPLPGVQIKLVNENEHAVEKRQAGQILAKGPGVFREYWQKPDATFKSFTSDGWFRTGDIAKVENNYYRILGRNSVDIIKSGGYKISALEIEEALLRHPGIRECAVVGIQDEEWGEIIGACLITDAIELDTQQLKNWLLNKLSNYKLPRKYILVDSLPKNAMGKVMKKSVRLLFISHGASEKQP